VKVEEGADAVLLMHTHWQMWSRMSISSIDDDWCQGCSDVR
jgi:hypothetical protein